MDATADISLRLGSESLGTGDTGSFIDILVSDMGKGLLAQRTRCLAFPIVARNHSSIRQQFSEECTTFLL